jgi:hypothetical protein
MCLLPLAATRILRARTGFGVEIQSFHANPFTASVTLHGMVVTNPPAFPRTDFFEVREFRASARLFSLFGRCAVVDDAVIDIPEVTIVKDSRGVLNTALFQQGLAGPPPAADAPANPDGREREFLIKRLAVRWDRLVIADYSKRRPEVNEINLHFSHVYENVTDSRQLAGPVAAVLAPIAVVLRDIAPEAGTALRVAGGVAKKTGRKTGALMKGFWEALEKTLKK